MEKAYFGSASRQLQASSMHSCRSSARNLHSSGYTQTTCSQGSRWRALRKKKNCIGRLCSKNGRMPAVQHLLRSYKRFECNRDPKLSEVKCLEHRRSPTTTRRSIYTSSSRCGAPHCGAASTARACNSVALKCKAACLSVYTYKLTSCMSLCLWAILQENYREEYGLQTPTEP